MDYIVAMNIYRTFVCLLVPKIGKHFELAFEINPYPAECHSNLVRIGP